MKNKGTSALHTEDKNNNEGKKLRRIIRLNKCHVHSAIGWKGRPFYSYGSLSETELPKDKCPKGYIVLKIKGLGALPSCNPFNEEHGYIFLSRKEKGMDKKKYSIFKKLVIDELIDISREKFDGIKPNENLTESSSKSCIWKDGALSHVAVDTLPDLIDYYSKRKIIVCKHNNARTGSEQSCDLSKNYLISV